MCSWLPLNLINILNDIGTLDTILKFVLQNFIKPFVKYIFAFRSAQLYRLVFSMCHLLGVTSALTNPLFYGYFNEVINYTALRQLSLMFNHRAFTRSSRKFYAFKTNLIFFSLLWRSNYDTFSCSFILGMFWYISNLPYLVSLLNLNKIRRSASYKV